ncbi:MAG: ABC transporter substrate-binding protein [Nitratireductor sp.]|nr:ABC transporter substrate-binding protein [Nitratireductor sp.]
MKRFGLKTLLATASVALLLTGMPMMASAQEPQSGGTIVELVSSEPPNLVGAFGGATTLHEISDKIFDKLLEDKNGEYEPRLAESWEVSPDGRTFTFHLNPSVKWHDGTPFTSADVAFTMTEIWKKFGGILAYGRITGVETPDEHTVVFKAENQIAPQLLLGTLGNLQGLVLPKHIYENTDYKANPANLAPIGSGPYKFKEWVKGQYIVLERNPDYYRKPYPYLDGIVVRFERSANTRAAALEAGDAHLGVRSPVALRDLDRIEKLDNLAYTAAGSEGAVWLQQMEVNLQHEITANPLVRKAIAHAINKEKLVSLVYAGHAKPATGPIPSTIPSYTKDVDTYGFDPAKAEALLDEAGYPRKSDGKRFPLKLVVGNWFETQSQSADLIAQDLADVGIDVTIDKPAIPAFIGQVYKNYDFDITLTNSVNYSEPGVGSLIWLWTKGIIPGVPWRNASHYSNPEMDAVIEASLVEQDPSKRMEQLHTFQKLAARDLPIIYLVEMDMINVYNKKLHNVGNHPRWYYTNWEDLWLEH